MVPDTAKEALSFHIAAPVIARSIISGSPPTSAEKVTTKPHKPAEHRPPCSWGRLDNVGRSHLSKTRRNPTVFTCTSTELFSFLLEIHWRSASQAKELDNTTSAIKASWFGWFLNGCTNLLNPRVHSSSFSTAACGLPRILKSIFSSISSSAKGSHRTGTTLMRKFALNLSSIVQSYFRCWTWR